MFSGVFSAVFTVILAAFCIYMFAGVFSAAFIVIPAALGIHFITYGFSGSYKFAFNFSPVVNSIFGATFNYGEAEASRQSPTGVQ